MKKVLSLLLSALLLITAVPIVSFTTSADYEYVTLGSYPQSKVTDVDTLSALSEANKEWISYGYMESQNTPGDYMLYCDIDLDGDGTNDYRGVKFFKYRPSSTTSTASTSASTYQDDNGYNIDTEYYFAYESLKWRVLDAETGLVMCESIIDSQAYNDYYYDGYVDAAKTTYCNKWETSSIRQWLNEDFYNTAFSSADKTHITQSSITNKGYSSTYDYDDTEDNIFLLSYDDMVNKDYGIDSTTRQAQGTDYAKSQGLYVLNARGYVGNSCWYLRSAGYDSCKSCSVNYYRAVEYYGNPYSTCNGGVRPAFYYNPESEISQSCEHENTEVRNAVDATCTTDGYTGDTYCTDCEELLENGTTIPALGHTAEIIPSVIPTCTNTGLTEGKKCALCGEIIVPQSVINAQGHVDEDADGYCDICEKQLLLNTFTCPLCEKTYTNWFANSAFLAIHSVVHIIYALICSLGIAG